jgi:hypothetical protein
MDNNPDSANDIYEIKIGRDASIVVERWCPDENGMIHFGLVSHEDIVKMVWFVERCMSLNATETIA